MPRGTQPVADRFAIGTGGPTAEVLDVKGGSHTSSLRPGQPQSRLKLGTPKISLRYTGTWPRYSLNSILFAWRKPRLTGRRPGTFRPPPSQRRPPIHVRS